MYSGQLRSGDVLENGIDMTAEDIVYSVAATINHRKYNIFISEI